jgi:hypothetical protein
MRFRKAIFLVIVLVIFTLLQGCSRGNSNAADSLSRNDQTPQNNPRWGGPGRRPDLLGQVKTVQGDKITVLKVEDTFQKLPEEERQEQGRQMQSLTSEERAKLRAERFKVSNETVEVTVPSGTPVLAPGSPGEKAAEVDISKIKQGDMLEIWLKQESSTDGKTTAGYIRIMPEGKPPQNNGGGPAEKGRPAAASQAT